MTRENLDVHAFKTMGTLIYTYEQILNSLRNKRARIVILIITFKYTFV